jgi:hypothetical protein
MVIIWQIASQSLTINGIYAKIQHKGAILVKLYDLTWELLETSFEVAEGNLENVSASQKSIPTVKIHRSY